MRTREELLMDLEALYETGLLGVQGRLTIADAIGTLKIQTEPARTLAAYALNILHGAKLEPFERDNLLSLASSVGVHADPTMLKRQAEQAAQLADFERAMNKMKSNQWEYKNSPWWKRLWGRK